MKLLIDDAHIEEIKNIYAYYPVDGVTTNPSILAKVGRNPYDVLKEIRAFIGTEAELHVQVAARDAEGMEEDAHRIQKELGETTYIKLPAVQEGFKAMKKLAGEGANLTATAIYTPMQAYLAGKAGARYAAPYVNRMDNMGYDGVGAACRMHQIFQANGMKTEVLAASFKNSQQLLELVTCGIGAATASPDVIRSLVKNAAIDSAVDAFVKDFEKLTAPNKTMATV